MHSRKRLANVIDQIITSEKDELEEVETSIVEDYKKLNDKCDAVKAKISERKKLKKSKKAIKPVGE